MRKLLVPALVALLTTSSALGAAGRIGQIKVLTLNFNNEIDPVDSDQGIRDLRFNAIRTWITENHPDLLLFQEGWNYRKDASFAIPLARAVGYDEAYRIGVGIPGFFMDSNIVLSKKSLGMRGERDLKLPHSAPEIGDGKTWVFEVGPVTYAVGVKLTLPNGDPFYVYTTHLLGSTPAEREDQLKAIDANARARAASDGVAWENAHVLIGGDLNCQPTEPGLAYLEANGYVETFEAVHPGDPSCTDCANPELPFFNPITIAYGQFPSQTDEVLSQRLDHILIHSPALRPLATTLTFTSPYGGFWMSDHYGVMTVLGDEADPSLPDPVRDTEEPLPDTVLIPLSNKSFECGASCTRVLPTEAVDSPRGVTFRNRSDFYVRISIHGPGRVFTAPLAGLNPGEATTFTFGATGDYTYEVENLMKPGNLYSGTITGVLTVRKTGYK